MEYKLQSSYEKYKHLYTDVLVFLRGDDVPLARNFELREFTCKCGNCREQLVSQELVHLLQKLRTKLNKPIIITSGYRCNTHNTNVSSSVDSYHTKGLAVDIRVTGVKPRELARIAREVGFKGGFGYHPNFLHLDLGGSRAWQY